MILKDKVILILGGTGSIGSAIAEVFEKEGAIVCRHGLGSGEYLADLGNSEEIEGLIKKVIAVRGRIDIIINSVSASVKIAPFEKKNWQDFLGHLNVQLKAAVETALLSLPHMKQQGGGGIINIITSYVSGDVPSSLSDYVTAKYALLGLTKSLAKDLSRYKVRVNAVSPSFIRNRFTKAVPEKFDDIAIAQSPLGRLTAPDDIAQAVLKLVSEDVTGKNIIINGGNVESSSL